MLLSLFKRFNLSQYPYPMKGPMDIIFCRNVMIYFENQLKMNMCKEFYRLLKPGGYLFIGHTETLHNLNTYFKAVAPAIYIKK